MTKKKPVKDLPDMSKKPTHPKKSRKPSRKKVKPVIAVDLASEPDRSTQYRILASVEITPEVEEILKSSEAKLYLRGIERANVKLQTMIAREMALLRHPAHPDHPKG